MIMIDKELLKLVMLSANGKDDIEKGTIGHGGYGFVLRDQDFFKEFSEEIFNYDFYRIGVEIGDQHSLSKDMKNGKFEMDQLEYYSLINALMIGSLKTLLPNIKFLDANDSDILLTVWVIIKTPEGKIFPVIYHYDRYRMAFGNLGSREEFCKKYPLICNYDPKNLSEEERFKLADAFEFALRKIHPTDYRTIYPGHDYSFYIEVNDGNPLFLRENWDDKGIIEIFRKKNQNGILIGGKAIKGDLKGYFN